MPIPRKYLSNLCISFIALFTDHGTATHRPIPIYPVSPRQMAGLLEGRLIPRQLLKHSLITAPSLEDYVMTPEASRVAKEAAELPEVLAYKTAIGLSFDKPNPSVSNDIFRCLAVGILRAT